MSRALPLLLLPALASVALVACSQNNGKTVQATAELQGLTNTPQIIAREYSFSPNIVQVPPGHIDLTLKDEGSQRHAFQLYSDEQYKDPVLGAHIDGVDPGGSQSISFDLPNEGKTFYFRCEIHPERMHGQFKIAAAGG